MGAFDFMIKRKGEVTSKNDRNLVKGNAFDVFIKQAGKFIKVGQPMTRNDALDYGAERVDKGSSASFKIVKTNKQPIPNRNVSIGYFNQNLLKFKSKRMTGNQQIFVEREQNRLDTDEEKDSISQKGIQKRRIGGFFKR